MLEVFRRKVFTAAVPLALLAVATPAHAAEIKFGSNDIVTVFFINKSDDKNRVDYGMRLDGNCAPINNDSVFPYWREFEKAPPVRTHPISFIEKVPYGFSEQKVVKKGPDGGETFVRLKQFDRPITIITKRDDNGKCSATAKTTIAKKTARLLSVFAKLAGPLSVDYIDVKGKDLSSGAAIDERIRK